MPERRFKIPASLLLAAATAAAAPPAAPQQLPTFGLPAPPAQNASSNSPAFRHIAGAIFALGDVRLDKEKRTIILPAFVNMTEGAVEYALVHNSGKVHESVLKTGADPLHVHLARLLVWPESEARPLQTGPAPPRDLIGPKIVIQVAWTQDGAPKTAPLEDLVWNTLAKAQMMRGPWVFNGSRVVESTFLAQRDGSIVAIYADPDALVNNPRPGRNDDEIWTVNSKLVPPLGTPVTVTLQLENADEE
jgi:hypothetical protein